MRGRPIDWEKIDWVLLKKQKQELVEMIWDEQDSILWGIVHLIDDIQDWIEPEESYHDNEQNQTEHMAKKCKTCGEKHDAIAFDNKVGWHWATHEEEE